MNMEVLSVTGVGELSKKLSSLNGRLVILFFYKEGSAECDQMSDVITELQKDETNKLAVVIKINASEDEEICKKYNVKVVPSFVFKGIEEVETVVGANVPLFKTKLETYVQELEGIEGKLKELINKSPIMLFMKGDRLAPRCGFSNQVITLLDKYTAEMNTTYETFDILQDFSVREGLKRYSNWPTYPQLYVNGNLIGGLDVLKQYNSEEIKQALSGESV